MNNSFLYILQAKPPKTLNVHYADAKDTDFSRFNDVGSNHHKLMFLKAQRILQNKNCKHIYIDIGTNIGMQIRKLYQPELYPEAKSIQWFSEFFGPADERHEVCAFGIEANPKHTSRLKQVEDAYTKMNFNVVIFTETAAGTENGEATFFTTPSVSEKYHEWGASLMQYGKGMQNVTIGKMDVAEFLKEMIFNRPNITSESKVMLKLDIEGYEYYLLPHLYRNDVICKIDFIYLEFHPKFVKGSPDPTRYLAALKWDMGVTPNCRCNISIVDDEKYGIGNDTNALPTIAADKQNIVHY